jgi:predicted transcriptional regulator
MAEAIDRPRAWLMAEAIKQYVAREEWFINEVEKGVKDADEGNLINHADLKARWEAKRAAQVD